jgi:hypothetical protein
MTVAGWIAIAVLWVVVVCLALAVLALARQIGVLHERLQPVGALQLSHGLRIGEPAPSLEVTDLSGRSLNVGAAHPAGLDTLVVFVSPTRCAVAVARAARRSGGTGASRVNIVLAATARLEHDHCGESLESPLSDAGVALGRPAAARSDRQRRHRRAGGLVSFRGLDLFGRAAWNLPRDWAGRPREVA